MLVKRALTHESVGRVAGRRRALAPVGVTFRCTTQVKLQETKFVHVKHRHSPLQVHFFSGTRYL
jgi:hypothetical protein